MMMNVGIENGNDRKGDDMFTTGCCIICLSVRKVVASAMKQAADNLSKFYKPLA